MADHYYTKHPSSAMMTETRKITLKGHDLTFITSSGVFSKKGIDFGTKTLIDAFQEPEPSGALLDLGCGYGPIGISLAKEYAARDIILADINERALKLARENAAYNNVDNVEVVDSEGFHGLKDRKLAAVITNPPIRAGKKVVYQMMKDAYEHLVDDGQLWVVIQKKQGAPSLIKFLETFFQEVKEVDRKKGYFIIRADKKSS